MNTMNRTILALSTLLTMITAANAFAAFGQCRDPWVTRAIQEVTGKAPFGEGDSGACNIRLYGGGRWSSYEDLKAKVGQAMAYWKSHPRECRDAWVTKAITEVTGYAPSHNAEFDVCNMYNYRNGNWRSYEDLRAAVAVHYGRFVANGFKINSDGRLMPGGTPLGVQIAPNGDMTASGKVIAKASQWAFAGPGLAQNNRLISVNHGNLITDNGAGLVAAGAGNVLSQITRLIGNDAGSLVGPDGASLKVKFPDGSSMRFAK